MDSAGTVDRAVIAAPPGLEDEIGALASAVAPSIVVTVTPGGTSRSESVAAALEVAGASDEVIVHDAARPLVSAALIDRCVAQLRRWRCDGVVAAARAVDTIKEADAGGRVIATLERSRLWAVQTPQVFTFAALSSAIARGDLDRAYDDAQLVEAVGGDVRIVESPRENLKVTTPHDLRVAALLLSDRTR